jgi:hypothetical protein
MTSIAATLDQPGMAGLGLVLHDCPKPLGADREVHRASDGGCDVITGAGPVRQIAILRHLERAEHAEIEVAASDQRETIGLMHIRPARAQRDVLLARVD